MEEIVMQDILNFVGSFANAVAAGCAVFAIIETHTKYKQDKQDEKDLRISEKKSTLYKESVIDFLSNDVMKSVSEINKEMLNIASSRPLDQDALKEVYNHMRIETQGWIYELEILKFFNQSLYVDVKKRFETIIDLYSKIINRSIKSGYLSRNYGTEINKELTNIKKRLYKEYLEML